MSLLVQSAFAQILVSAGSPYTQNFDSLASSGTPPADTNWTDNVTIPGWYASQSVAPDTISAYRVGSGTVNNGALYSFGVAGLNPVTDRALGSIASGTPGNFAYGVRFQNDTTMAITNITISYTGEQWRNGGNTATQTLAFSYFISNNPITSSDAGNANAWVAFSALSFNSPTVGATAAALDGNAAANRQVFPATVLTNIVVFPGQEIFFRWYDINDSGNDHALAVDDVTVTFSAVTTNAPTYATVIPTARTNRAGTTASFTVANDGSPAVSISYQWRKGGTALSDTGNIFGSTTSMLTLSNVIAADAGSYDVIVANSAGSVTSGVATVTVVFQPSITQQPQSWTVAAGTVLNLSVTASGTAPLGYQWLNSSGEIAGATNATYTLNPAQTNNADGYFVVVTNPYGSVTSGVATVTVYVPVSITTQPASQVVPARSTVLFSVVAGGYPAPAYQWQFNGRNIAGATASSLTLTNVQWVQAGNYLVIVSNALGAVTSSTAVLTIIDTEPPTIVCPVDLTTNTDPGQCFASGVSLGTPVASDNCGVADITNDAPPQFPMGQTVVTWTATDTSGNSATCIQRVTVIDAEPPSITCPANIVVSADPGGCNKSNVTYAVTASDNCAVAAVVSTPPSGSTFGEGSTVVSCVARDASGNTNSCSFTVTVQAPPIITFQPTNQTVNANAPVTFSVEAAGTQPLSYQWRCNGTNFVDDLRISGSATATLSISDVLARDAGTYSVVVSNSFGSVTSTGAVLTVIGTCVSYLYTETAGGGEVHANPLKAPYPCDAEVTLTAVPAADWVFLTWLNYASGTNAQTTIVMNKSKCVRAVFGTRLGATAFGPGRIIVDPNTAFYPYGTIVRLTAVPQNAYYFSGWIDDYGVTVNPRTYVNDWGNYTIAASFAALGDGQFALTVIPDGKGRVDTMPWTNQYAGGTMVTNVAMAEPGQAFLGWSGDTNGALIDATNLVLTIDASRIIFASFTKRPSLVIDPCWGGMSEDGFHLSVVGDFGHRYGVEFTAELSAGSTLWVPLFTLTNAFGTVQFTDGAATNLPQRLYRAVQVSP